MCLTFSGNWTLDADRLPLNETLQALEAGADRLELVAHDLVE